jgi:hypothetical protein
MEEEKWYSQALPVQARRLVFDYIIERLEKTDTHVEFSFDDVYVVWFSKTLQNWKAMLSTTLPDGMYYEVTYDGDKHQAYIDAYKKFDNVCVPDDVVDQEKVQAAMTHINGLLNTSKYNPAGPDRFA